jgi:hypothetical protein
MADEHGVVADFARECAAAILVEVGDYDASAFAGQQQSILLADTAGAAGDDYNFPVNASDAVCAHSEF